MAIRNKVIALATAAAAFTTASTAYAGGNDSNKGGKPKQQPTVVELESKTKLDASLKVKTSTTVQQNYTAPGNAAIVGAAAIAAARVDNLDYYATESTCENLRRIGEDIVTLGAGEGGNAVNKAVKNSSLLSGVGYPVAAASGKIFQRLSNSFWTNLPGCKESIANYNIKINRQAVRQQKAAEKRFMDRLADKIVERAAKAAEIKECKADAVANGTDPNLCTAVNPKTPGAAQQLVRKEGGSTGNTAAVAASAAGAVVTYVPGVMPMNVTTRASGAANIHVEDKNKVKVVIPSTPPQKPPQHKPPGCKC